MTLAYVCSFHTFLLTAVSSELTSENGDIQRVDEVVKEISVQSNSVGESATYLQGIVF